VFNSPFDPEVPASHGVMLGVRRGLSAYEFRISHYMVAVIIKSTDVPTLAISTYTPLRKHKVERANQLREEMNTINSFLNLYPNGRILKCGDQNMRSKQQTTFKIIYPQGDPRR
jgi:hypothetical protein